MFLHSQKKKKSRTHWHKRELKHLWQLHWGTILMHARNIHICFQTKRQHCGLFNISKSLFVPGKPWSWLFCPKSDPDILNNLKRCRCNSKADPYNRGSYLTWQFTAINMINQAVVIHISWHDMLLLSLTECVWGTVYFPFIIPFVCTHWPNNHRVIWSVPDKKIYKFFFFFC